MVGSMMNSANTCFFVDKIYLNSRASTCLCLRLLLLFTSGLMT